MPGRQLRPRGSQPSYVAMLQTGDNEFDEDHLLTLAEGDSGSDFEEEKVFPDPDEVMSDLDGGKDTSEEGDLEAVGPSKGKEKAKSKNEHETSRVITSATPTLSRPAHRQMYALPNPNINHRHRAVPLFTRPGKVDRLEQPPSLFAPPKLTLTNNFTTHPGVTDRVNKAWGHNVGSGPLWELLEDRGWYKEAIEDNQVGKEYLRRPKVYSQVAIKGELELLTLECVLCFFFFLKSCARRCQRRASGLEASHVPLQLDIRSASQYFPTDVATTDEGNLKPPPPVTCSFGPYDAQTPVTLKMFDSFNHSRYIPESKAHIFNAGGPVWGLDWCPIHPDDRPHHSYKQYLAVAPFPTRSYSPEIGFKVTRPSYSSIQIWCLQPSPVEHGPDHGEMACKMILCLEGGPAHEIKWCPLPSHDNYSSHSSPRKLGLLAGTFSDGSLSIYAVPDPASITPVGKDSSNVIYVRIPEPLLRIKLEETSCWTLDWANSETIAVGCTNGAIAVYDIAQALKAGDGPNILPTNYITVHQAAVRALAWVRAPPSTSSGTPFLSGDPTIIASGGYDGVECLTDIREPHGNVMNRTRDVITCMAYSIYGSGPVTIDHENIVKIYSISPSMLGRGHVLIDPSGPAWSIGTSEYHPHIAVGAADGCCYTTNTLRFTRRGGSVPFFVYKIYQLDYSRRTNEFRMLERFLPQESQERSTATRTQREKQAVGTGAWSQEVGIHRVAWNNGGGLAGASLLASATASGLCRVDWLEGRWVRDRVPYGGIENIRKEVEGIDDDDGEDSE